MIRVGQGVDVHAFSDDPQRALVLGGVVLADGPGLAGHSDADVVLHAITDAVLGAAARGDLGALVGVDRPETAGADSAGFLREAVALVARDGWTLGNIDATVIAQRPRLAPHIPAIRDSVATITGIEPGAVSVKATTTDRLGAIGQGEGVACLAVAVLARGPAS